MAASRKEFLLFLNYSPVKRAVGLRNIAVSIELNQKKFDPRIITSSERKEVEGEVEEPLSNPAAHPGRMSPRVWAGGEKMQHQ